MKLQKIYPHAYYVAIILVPLYLFIVLLHLFFIPSFQGTSNDGNNLVFKKNAQYLYYLIRNDRSTFKENSKVKAQSHIVKSSCFDSTAACLNSHLNKLSLNPKLSQFMANHHYSYLFNLVIMI
jgi:hypothetical protein